jgi:hypothetical protein
MSMPFEQCITSLLRDKQRSEYCRSLRILPNRLQDLDCIGFSIFIEDALLPNLPHLRHLSIETKIIIRMPHKPGCQSYKPLSLTNVISKSSFLPMFLASQPIRHLTMRCTLSLITVGNVLSSINSQQLSTLDLTVFDDALNVVRLVADFAPNLHELSIYYDNTMMFIQGNNVWLLCLLLSSPLLTFHF